MTDKYVWAVRVIDNGGEEPRDLEPPAYDTEAETGALIEVQFWPPSIGFTRYYLSRSGAYGRRDMWQENGVQSEITKSMPVFWSSPGAEERVAARLWQVRPLTADNLTATARLVVEEVLASEPGKPRTHDGVRADKAIHPRGKP